MSRDAVKFGRMSKKQRDSLHAEVQKHRQQQQQQQQHEVVHNQRQQQRHTELHNPRQQHEELQNHKQQHIEVHSQKRHDAELDGHRKQQAELQKQKQQRCAEVERLGYSPDQATGSLRLTSPAGLLEASPCSLMLLSREARLGRSLGEPHAVGYCNGLSRGQSLQGEEELGSPFAPEYSLRSETEVWGDRACMLEIQQSPEHPQQDMDRIKRRSAGNVSEVQNPYPELNYWPFLQSAGPSVTELDYLTQNVWKSHQETCQFHLEDLRLLRGQTFTREEVAIYHRKSMEEMWERCAWRITEAVQYVVEFAKRMDGFMTLCQNDQIVLVKAGAMEVILVRMCRAFNADNNTVFFEGKYAGPEIFRSLGCSDLISSIFSFSQGLSELRLTEQEIALFSASVLMNASHPWIQEKGKVTRLQWDLAAAFKQLLKTHRREGILAKLPPKGRLRSLCQEHMERLRLFRDSHAVIVHTLFPPLYQELFTSDTDPQNAVQ